MLKARAIDRPQAAADAHTFLPKTSPEPGKEPPTGLLQPYAIIDVRLSAGIREASGIASPPLFVTALRGQVSLPFMGTPPPIELGSLGMADSLILMVLALVVFGPRRLPQIGRQIGKLMYEFRKASNDFKFQMEEELRLSEDADRRKKEEEKRKQQAQESVSAPPAVVNALESPYPGETHYPELTAAESKPVEPEPRILPPSTGETVDRRPPSAEPADPPTDTAVAVPEHASTATSVVSSEPAAAAPASDNDSPASQTVSHNG